jgi:hypothetical protein
MVMSVFYFSSQIYLKIYLKVKWSRWGASRLQQLSVNYWQIVQVAFCQRACRQWWYVC